MDMPVIYLYTSVTNNSSARRGKMDGLFGGTISRSLSDVSTIISIVCQANYCTPIIF